MEKVELDLWLKWPEKEANRISLFYEVPPTIDDGVNSCFQEKIRKFNNSVMHLLDSVQSIESTTINDVPILSLCQDTGSEIDIIYRRMLRNVYMELFIYQEKLLNIVCNLFFVKVCRGSKSNMKALKKRIKYSAALKSFCERCDAFIIDKRCQDVMRIRDDEVHNMSQIDSFHYDLEKTETGVKPVTKGYKLKATDLRDNYIYTLQKLLEVRKSVQEILDQNDFWKIFYALKKDGQEIWIN